MDLPVLKYLDILIGLAVVMLMGSVLVTAVTQFVLSVSYARARYLRDGLSSLVRQIDRERLPEKTALYIASRLLRNPLIGRAPSPLGLVFTWIRNRGRLLLGKAELPGVNPADVIQREELVLFLLQWAAGEGLLLSQDEDRYSQQAARRIQKTLEAFAGASRAAAEASIHAFIGHWKDGRWRAWRILPAIWQLIGSSGLGIGSRLASTWRIYHAILDRRLESEAAKIRQSLNAALAQLGVQPDEALKKIRERAVGNERAYPSAASRSWYADAIASTVSAQLLGRVNTWFDNVIARVADNFSLEAKIWSAAAALIIVLSVQLDSLALLRRLETDDKLRALLVEEAQQESKAYEEAEKRLKEAQELAQSAEPGQKSGADPDREKLAMNLAADARVRIAEQLAVMREPKFALIPGYFIWQPVANVEMTARHLRAEGECETLPLEAVLKVDARRYALKLGKDPNRRLLELATAIRAAQAPVAVRLDAQRLRLVAASPETLEIAIERPPAARCYLSAVPPREWRRPNFWTWSTPADPPAPLAFKAVDIDGLERKFPGIFLSFVLLSLGGPFWYNVLKKALNFRSMLAFKDDEERKARQADQTRPRTQSRP
jgi:hypothetical protein